jgi:hypothetical protein
MPAPASHGSLFFWFPPLILVPGGDVGGKDAVGGNITMSNTCTCIDTTNKHMDSSHRGWRVTNIALLAEQLLAPTTAKCGVPVLILPPSLVVSVVP